MPALLGHNHSRKTTLKYRDEHAIFRLTFECEFVVIGDLHSTPEVLA